MGEDIALDSVYELIDEIIEKKKEGLIADTQKLIRIKTVRAEPAEGAPFGAGIKVGLDHVLNLTSSMGFSSINMDGHIGYAEYGEGEDYLAILAHLDVVPEGEENDWTYPPYEAHISEGKMYGRGTIDDKGPLMAGIYALKAVAESGIKLKHRVRIIIGTDEEVGGEDIEYYKTKEKMPILGFTPDANFPAIYAEKGILNLELDYEYDKEAEPFLISLTGGTALNSVPAFAKAELKVTDRLAIEEQVEGFNRIHSSKTDKGGKVGLALSFEGETCVIKAYGISAHGSTPELGTNAVNLLLQFLTDNRLLGAENQRGCGALLEKIYNETAGQNFGIACRDDSGALSLNLGLVSIEGGKASFGVDIRYPASGNTTEIVKKIEASLRPYSFSVNNSYEEKPLYYPKDHELIKNLTKVYKEYTGSDAKALAIGGGTYAKYLDNIVAFGPVYPGQEEVEHQNDEYIPVDQLIDITKIYARAIIELARA